MAYGTIRGSRIHEVREPAEVKACPRCGHERKARKNAGLCESCVSTMTPAERAAWRPAA